MLGTIVNTMAVIAGGCIGTLLRRGIPEKLTDAVMQGIALCVLAIEISGVLEGQNTLVMIVSVAAGAAAGTLMNLDERLNRLGQRLEQRRYSGNDRRGQPSDNHPGAECAGSNKAEGYELPSGHTYRGRYLRPVVKLCYKHSL